MELLPLIKNIFSIQFALLWNLKYIARGVEYCRLCLGNYATNDFSRISTIFLFFSCTVCFVNILNFQFLSREMLSQRRKHKITCYENSLRKEFGIRVDFDKFKIYDLMIYPNGRISLLSATSSRMFLLGLVTASRAFAKCCLKKCV